MQPKVGAATLVRYRKAIAADPNLAFTHDGKADAAGSNDDDTAISGAMRPDAGDCRVIDVNNGTEGMLPLYQLLQCTFAADARKTDGSMHETQRAGVEVGFLERGPAGPFNFGKRAVDSQAKRGGAGNAGPPQSAFRVFDPRAAPGTAAVDTYEQRARL